MVQWLGIQVFMPRARVQSLVRELRSQKPCGTAKVKMERGKKRLRASCGPSVLPVRLGLPLSPPLTGLMLGRRATTHYPTPVFTVYLSSAISSHPSPSSTPQTFLHPMSAQTSTARPWASTLSGTASLRNG